MTIPKQVGIIKAFCTREVRPSSTIVSARVIDVQREGDAYHLEIYTHIDCVRCGAILSEKITWLNLTI